MRADPRFPRFPSLLLLAALAASACRDTPAPTEAAGALSPARAEASTDAATYTPQALSVPANAITGEGSAINAAGDVAGWFQTSQGWRAVRWSGTQRLDLGTLPGMASSLAKGINDAGAIVGNSFASAFFSTRAFVWTPAGGMKSLQDLGGDASLALAINNSGVAAGWASDPNGVVHAVRWGADRKVTDLNPAGATSQALAVNDSGDVVGWVFLPFGAGSHAYLWRHDGTQLDLGTLGGPGSQAYGVNSKLAIVGVSDRRSPMPPVGFIWTPARGMRPLAMGPNSQALGISELGRSVGISFASGVTGLTQFRGVASKLPDLAPAKGPFSGPTAVNRCGTIVGSGASPVPTNGNVIPVIWRTSVCDGAGSGR